MITQTTPQLKPYYQSGSVTLYHGNALEVVPQLGHVCAIVTDPPYGLSFMGKKWDYDVPSVEIWQACLDALRPGGHLLAFAGTRTQHRMAVRIEDAGFEIRDMIAWVYGSGFPKSMDVSKAIDKGQSENKARQLRFTAWMRSTGITAKQIKDATGTDMASHYLTEKSQPAIATADLFDKLRPYLPEVPEEIERLVAERTGIEWPAYKDRHTVGKMIGYDTSKARPACSLSSQGIDKSAKREYEITAPATDAAKQWHGWGTSLKPALEPITMARKPLEGTVAANVLAHGCGGLNVDACRVETDETLTGSGSAPLKHGGQNSRPFHETAVAKGFNQSALGRFPANLIHDGSDEVVGLFPEQVSGANPTRRGSPKFRNTYAMFEGQESCEPARGPDAGSAARFFYCAKASRSERGKDNTHPTVKPIDLMRYLIRLVNPPGGIVLDPFAGSGTTLLAARLEGAQSIGVELDEEHCETIARRLDKGLPF
jgi:DNA modification methylase